MAGGGFKHLTPCDMGKYKKHTSEAENSMAKFLENLLFSFTNALSW